MTCVVCEANAHSGCMLLRESGRISERSEKLQSTHACLSNQNHITATSVPVSANYMYHLIVDNPNYEPKSIICAVKEEFKYKISYNKAYRAKQKVLEMRWETYEASYHNMPALLQTIYLRNPGSYYDLKTYPYAQKPGQQVLQWSFLALGACIEAFPHCRPVICIDGTFLTGRYCRNMGQQKQKFSTT